MEPNIMNEESADFACFNILWLSRCFNTNSFFMESKYTTEDLPDWDNHFEPLKQSQFVLKVIYNSFGHATNILARIIQAFFSWLFLRYYHR